MLMPSLFTDNFDNNFNALFNGFYDDPWFNFGHMNDVEGKLYGHRAGNIMNTDIRETENGYEMMVDLPGFKKEDVTVELEKGYLTISAAKGLEEKTSENEEAEKTGKYIRKERYSGSCQRKFYLGEEFQQEDIKASFAHGILTLNIPKKDAQAIEAKKYIQIEG